MKRSQRQKRIIFTNLELLKSDSFNYVLINKNEVWQKLKNHTNDFKIIADSSDDYYFGLRAAENGAKSVAFNPKTINNYLRLVKSLKKFKTTGIIKINPNDFLPSIRFSSEKFLIEISKIILDIENIHSDIELMFDYHEKIEWNKILFVISEMYKHKIILRNFPGSSNIKYYELNKTTEN